jgi:CheY-like chemotaxis protein
MPAAHPLRVLVVDDNADYTQSQAMLLSAAGYETQTALNGLLAVEIATEWRPDAVLMDLRMPILDGFAAAMLLRDLLGKKALLVAVTAYDFPADRRRAAECGFDHFVVKEGGSEEFERLLQDYAARLSGP